MRRRKRAGVSDLLRERHYRRLFLAQTASRWGDTFHIVALAILVFRLTGSGLGVTGVVVAEIIPVLLLAPVAGELVDRLPRRALMVGADLWRAALVAALPLVDGSVAAVYAVAVGLSAGTVLFNPAAGSVLPALVPTDKLVAANSGIWTSAVLSQILLAPVAGGLVVTVGVTPAFWLNAASYLVSAALLSRLSIPRAAATTRPGERWGNRVRQGGRALVRDPLLRVLAVGQLLAALSAGATSALLVVLAARHVSGGEESFGLLLAAIGVGAASGPFLLTRLTDDPRRPVFVFGPYLLRGGVDIALATFSALPLAMAALAVYGLGTSTGAVTFNSLLQAEVDEDMRGRVFAGMDVLWQAGRLVSLAAGGVLAETLGIRAVYYLGGLLLLVAGVIGLLSVKTATRHHRQHVVGGRANPRDD